MLFRSRLANYSKTCIKQPLKEEKMFSWPIINCWHFNIMSKIDFVLSWVEHEKSFITWRPGNREVISLTKVNIKFHYACCKLLNHYKLQVHNWN